jgi:hypothetical protein
MLLCVLGRGGPRETSCRAYKKKKPREAGLKFLELRCLLAVLRILVLLSATLATATLLATLARLRLLLTWLLLAGLPVALLTALSTLLARLVLVLIHTFSSWCRLLRNRTIGCLILRSCEKVPFSRS